MIARSLRRMGAVVCLFSAGAMPAGAEILILEGGGVVAVESSYAFAHPSLRSVVFLSPESRQMAILPPAPVFVAPPPLLWRAPSPFPAYPPVSPKGKLNTPAGPSSRDNTTYNLQRAHAFSQELFHRDTYLGLGASSPLYFWSGGVMPAYPPVGVGGRPSNRDNTTYNLERAHRFSMDAYKKP